MLRFHGKLKQILLPALLVLSIQSAYANIIIRAPANMTADACAMAQGTWSGGGTIAAGPVSCHYRGTAIVTPAPANSAYNYTIAMDLTRDAGICPQKASATVAGTCTNNLLTINTDNAALFGAINASGTAADITGTVYIDISGNHMEATISDMHLQKQ
jgi:hypothetical protein